jgi:8-oxo-dGTP pyrophosphatase MutT (NUDIX family)
MTNLRFSRCAYAVIKLCIGGQEYFLMRRDPSWGDVTFVGGHIEQRDSGSLKRTVQREMLEEVPPLRSLKRIQIQPLTDELKHGPLFSPSAGRRTLYHVQFFLILFDESPEHVLATLTARSLNVLLKQCDLIDANIYRVATLVELLDKKYPQGLQGIPFSWPQNIDDGLLNNATLAQQDLAFN